MSSLFKRETKGKKEVKNYSQFTLKDPGLLLFLLAASMNERKTRREKPFRVFLPFIEQSELLYYRDKPDTPLKSRETGKRNEDVKREIKEKQMILLKSITRIEDINRKNKNTRQEAGK